MKRTTTRWQHLLCKFPNNQQENGLKKERKKYFIEIATQKDDERRKVENYGHAGQKLKNIGVGK